MVTDRTKKRSGSIHVYVSGLPLHRLASLRDICHATLAVLERGTNERVLFPNNRDMFRTWGKFYHTWCGTLWKLGPK